MRILSAICIASIVLYSGTASATPILFEVDSEASTTTLELCESITGTCDSDTSPIAGFLVLDVNSPQDLQQLTILYFEFALTQSLNLSYNLGFGSTLSVTGQNLATQYALDGPTGPEPIGPTGEVFFPAVALANSGTLSYNSSPILCLLLQSQSIACSASIDLAESGIIEAPVQATIERQGDFLVVTISIVASFDGADLPDNPPVSGTITTTLQAFAEVPIPACPADVTGDGEVNLADLNLVLANFGQSTNDGDTNGDGVVDLADLNAVLAAFGTTCPSL